jgi:hypothetical protein
MVSAARLTPEDLAEIVPQASQRMTCGIDTSTVDDDTAEALCAQDEAWAIRHDGRLIAAFGIVEQFAGVHGYGWAILSDCIGAAHLAMTRFARSRIVGAPLKRIELIVRCTDIEAILDEFPGLDNGQIVEAVCALPTPECVWARLIGMKPAHGLRKFGALTESHMLFERIN